MNRRGTAGEAAGRVRIVEAGLRDGLPNEIKKRCPLNMQAASRDVHSFPSSSSNILSRDTSSRGTPMRACRIAI